MNSRTTRKSVYGILAATLLLTGCMRAQFNSVPSLPTPREIDSTPQAEAAPTQISAPRTEPAASPMPTTTPVSAPETQVTVTAAKGNLYIRRGPDTAYNPIGVLYKGNSANVIGRDMLSKWVQVQIPGKEATGWVSIQTEYSSVEGNLETMPPFTFTEWPLPAYLRNCTFHEMYIEPGGTVLPSILLKPNNEIWLDPGNYAVYDLDVPGEPEVISVDIREGLQVDITEDATGDRHKCE